MARDDRECNIAMACAGAVICFIAATVFLIVMILMYRGVDHEHAIYNVHAVDNFKDTYRAEIDNDRKKEAEDEIVKQCNITDTADFMYEGENCHHYNNGKGNTEVDCHATKVRFKCSNKEWIDLISQNTDDKYHEERRTILKTLLPLTIISYLAGFGCIGLVYKVSGSCS